ncbi:MAG: NAD(P)/FAD-dependent oxidoreductase [Gammaproteobacteria bacterium]
MKIAIVGTGIAGNTAAYHLCREHDITVFEANDYVGGHTHTVDVRLDGRDYAVDTGFIVFNDWTYPNFIALLDELGVASQPSTMSFSVRCDGTGLEYNGGSLNGLFAQRGNLFRPAFLGMLRDILRFNRAAPRLLDGAGDECPLGDYLAEGGYGRDFINRYLIPMGAAIWSSDPRRMFDFPARSFVRFFHNHGLLNLVDRPQWRVIRGGSRSYLEPLTAAYRARIRRGTPVARIARSAGQAELTLGDGSRARFEAVFLACHSDQALRLLAEPSTAEREVLGAIPYQTNEVVLHTDTRLLPRSRRAWAAWNYHIPEHPAAGVSVTYDMNILQGLDAPETFCVTLNETAAIDPARVIERYSYEHPVYTPEGVAAQARHREIDGTLNTYYCGAYWRHGFHEDGVVSAQTAVDHFRQDLRDAQLSLRRTG